jgi:hypothetical protein
MSSLFEQPGQKGSKYDKLRTSDHPQAVKIRAWVDTLWKDYERFADPEFKIEYRNQIDSRYWEMYLTSVFLGRGLEVECHKPGPDILIIQDARRIWVEAVAPTQGAPDSKDRVPDFEINAVRDYPETQILLRYRSAIQEKRDKYAKYLQDRIVLANDACVVAINSAKIPVAFLGTTVPDILKALFPVGHLQVHIRKSDLKAVGTDYQYRPTIQKSSRRDVDTDIFLNPAYAFISAVLFSTTSIDNPPAKVGEELVLVHNPLATAPLPDGWLGLGVEYKARINEDEVVIEPTRIGDSG